MLTEQNYKGVRLFGIGAAALCISLALCVSMARAQDPERDAQDIKRGRITKVDAGTPIPVRIQESIDVENRTEQVYQGVVTQDVRDAKGHIAIPGGSPVSLKVRAGPDNELTLDIEAITVNSERFGVWSEADQVEALRDDSSLATIVDPAPDVQVRGRAIRVPSGSVLTFRIEHTMIVGIQVRHPGEATYARQNLSDLS
jgi:hypothetical protein